MLSYEQIGAAAMMSRATRRHGIGGKAIFVLPGIAEHAVRLAMTKLILPELGHVVQQLQPMMRRSMQRAVSEHRCGRSGDDRARRGAAIIDGALRRRSSAIERVAAATTTHGRVLAQRRRRDGRRPAVLARGDGRLRACAPQTRPARTRTTPTTLHVHREGLHRPDAARTVGAGECIEIATGAPMPAGADAVVMVEETAADDDADSASSRRRNRGRTSAARARTSRAARPCCAPATC